MYIIISRPGPITWIFPFVSNVNEAGEGRRDSLIAQMADPRGKGRVVCSNRRKWRWREIRRRRVGNECLDFLSKSCEADRRRGESAVHGSNANSEKDGSIYTLGAEIDAESWAWAVLIVDFTFLPSASLYFVLDCWPSPKELETWQLSQSHEIWMERLSPDSQSLE